MYTFDGTLDILVRVENILLDEFQRSGPMGQLVIERVGQSCSFQHALSLGK